MSDKNEWWWNAVGPVASGLCAIVAAFFARKSALSAERSKAFSATVVGLETEPMIKLETWHKSLSEFAQSSELVVRSEEINHEGEYFGMNFEFNDGLINVLIEQIDEEYPCVDERKKVSSLVRDIKDQLREFKSSGTPEALSGADLSEVRKAISALKALIWVDLTKEKDRLKGK